jgi:hypothetical protein
MIDNWRMPRRGIGASVLKSIGKNAISRPDWRAGLPAQAPSRWREAGDTPLGPPPFYTT